MSILVIRRALLILMSASLYFAPSASAQTRFEWPKVISFDPSRYTSVDMCLGTVERRKDSITKSLPIFRDTLPVSGQEFVERLPDFVVNVARACSDQFHPSHISKNEIPYVFELFLLANRDADAQVLLKRRLDAIPADSQKERAAVLDTFAFLYYKATPVRLEASESLWRTIIPMGPALPAHIKIDHLHQLMQTADFMGDTDRARRFAEWILAVPGTLPEEEAAELYSKWPRLSLWAAQTYLKRAALLDSLRYGTEGYVAIQHESWRALTGERGTAIPFPIGEQAPQLQGDFWFPNDASKHVYPTPGKVSLVVFFKETNLNNNLNTMAALRRLAERFPDVSVVVAVQTRGSFGPLVTDNTEEAEWWRKRMQEFYRTPGVLTVSTTPFWRLPDPDRRPVAEDVPNTINYSFGKTWDPKGGSTFVVDRQGTLVWIGSLSRTTESQFADVIEALLARKGE